MEIENSLKKVNDFPVILNLLNGAKNSGAEVYIWRFIGKAKHIVNARIESVLKTRKEISISIAEGYESKAREMLNHQTFVDLYIPSSALLLRCDLKNSEIENRYFLKIPQTVAQLERRKSLRLNVYEAGEVNVTFTKSVTMMKTVNQQFQKSCFDISSGGVSFFVSKMELKFFQEKDLINNMVINAGKFSAKINAKITIINEIIPDEFNGLPYKVWRVSCAFINPDSATQKYLEKFIFERIKTELSAISKL